MLSQMVRDTFVIPLSTIASKLTLSWGVFDAYHSSLVPQTVKLMMC